MSKEIKEPMGEEELKENLDVFEDEDLLEALGGKDSIIPLEDIPSDQLID